MISHSVSKRVQSHPAIWGDFEPPTNMHLTFTYKAKMCKVTLAWSDLLTLKTFYQFTGFQTRFYRLVKRIRRMRFFQLDGLVFCY